MDKQTSQIDMNGDGNVIGDGNIVVINKGHFPSKWQSLREALVEPREVFDRVMLDHFAGREWLVGKIDAFLQNKDRGYFVLQAEAGLGKTTFLAWLVNKRGYIQHFCELAPGLEGVKTGLKSLTAQLTVACRLSPGRVQDMLPDAAERPDYLYRMLCLAAESRKPGDKIVLVIDALDSAGTPHDQNTLALPKGLPRGVFIIVSMRPTFVKLQVDDATTPRAVVRLSAGQAANRDDARRFLEAATRWPGIEQALQESGFASRRLVEVLLQKSGGVWIYLHFVIHEIERGDRTLEQLDGLPDGLTRYYGDYWMRQRDKAERKWDELYLPLLATLAAAPDAVPIQSLIAWACISSTPVQEVRRLLGVQWRAFISATQRNGQDTYHFYHASLREFFTGLTESNVPVTDELDSLADEQEFVAEVRQATAEARKRIIAALRGVFATDATPATRRHAAMQLTRMHWFDVEDVGPAELSKTLDLVGGFLNSRAERWYLIQSVTAVLDSPSVCLSDRQRARLLVYRAGLLGNLGEIDAAANSHREAQGIADQLVQAGDGEPEDQWLSARILLGRGNNVGVQAEGLSDPSDEESRETLLEESKGLLLDAARLAMTYGKDPILLATIQKELCWTYALLQAWPDAEKAYQTALQVLEETDDREARNSYRARVLEAGGEMCREKAERLKHDLPQALNEYQRALDLVEEQIAILKEADPSVLLVKAYVNWGGFGMAVDQLTGERPPQYLDRACERWRAAAELALALGMPQWEEIASQLVMKHCPVPASSAPTGAGQT